MTTEKKRKHRLIVDVTSPNAVTEKEILENLKKHYPVRMNFKSYKRVRTRERYDTPRISTDFNRGGSFLEILELPGGDFVVHLGHECTMRISGVMTGEDLIRTLLLGNEAKKEQTHLEQV